MCGDMQRERDGIGGGDRRGTGEGPRGRGWDWGRGGVWQGRAAAMQHQHQPHQQRHPCVPAPHDMRRERVDTPHLSSSSAVLDALSMAYCTNSLNRYANALRLTVGICTSHTKPAGGTLGHVQGECTCLFQAHGCPTNKSWYGRGICKAQNLVFLIILGLTSSLFLASGRSTIFNDCLLLMFMLTV